MTASLLERAVARHGLQAVYDSLPADRREEVRYRWDLLGRPEQTPPEGDWTTWLVMAGRGFGKTRTGAEFIRNEVTAGRMSRVAIVAPTASDARDVMIEGESGLLNICPPDFRPLYEPSKRRLTWPNGAMATTFTADEPDRLRGPQHDGAWSDEIATWRYPEAWDMLQFGLRLGVHPRQVVTTTPRPVKAVRQLLCLAGQHKMQDGVCSWCRLTVDEVSAPTCVVTRGSTFDNRANLAPPFLQQIVARYERTRMGRQEIYAEVLDDVEGALWKREWFNYIATGFTPDLERVVVAIDPAGTSSEDADETGIVVAGRAKVDGERYFYVLADRSMRSSPEGWATTAIDAFDAFSADRIVAETNYGGDMVNSVLRTVRKTVPFKAVKATRGKAIRAEPIASLYQQGRVFHVSGLTDLEDQLCTWTSDDKKSPDRLDALVWALTELSEGSTANVRFL